jgi:hypothetical protein
LKLSPQMLEHAQARIPKLLEEIQARQEKP